GENEASKTRNSGIRLYLTTWKNPNPGKKVASIDFTRTDGTPAAPFCVAITAEGACATITNKRSRESPRGVSERGGPLALRGRSAGIAGQPLASARRPSVVAAGYGRRTPDRGRSRIGRGQGRQPDRHR